jgi:hypothetical protein
MLKPVSGLLRKVASEKKQDWFYMHRRDGTEFVRSISRTEESRGNKLKCLHIAYSKMLLCFRIKGQCCSYVFQYITSPHLPLIYCFPNSVNNTGGFEALVIGYALDLDPF